MRLGVVVVDIHYELEASHCGRQSQIWKSDTKLVIHSPVWMSGLDIRESRGSSQRGNRGNVRSDQVRQYVVRTSAAAARAKRRLDG